MAMINRIRVYSSPGYYLLVGFLGEYLNMEDVRCRILRISRSFDCAENNAVDPCAIQDMGEFSMSEVHRFVNGEKKKCKDKLVLKCECWGVIGLVKLLHCHYLLLIKSRKYLGSIGGHRLYKVSQVQRICLNERDENRALEQRYIRLFGLVDLNHGFYFSYTYPLWQNVQTNILVEGEEIKPTMYPFLSQFVWNSYLSQTLREHNNRQVSSSWVVPLIHGYIDQRQFLLNGQQFKIALIARRSRLCAGARYHRRGLDRNGRVANYAETEQIVIAVNKSLCKNYEIPRISSVVQVRGSVPLFWSQKASTFQPRPDITLQQQKQVQYQTTIKHFNHLILDYGNPIVVLNLLRQKEKHRETILSKEYQEAICHINKQHKEQSDVQIVYQPIDMKSEDVKAQGVLPTMLLFLEGALYKTGFFACNPQRDFCQLTEELQTPNMLKRGPISLQSGVLRTNCVDCLDRTNVAQYTFGLCALGHQLAALDLETREVKPGSSMAGQLMSMYERVGNALSQQYGGSNAHSKVFSKQRGEQWSRTKLKDMFVSMRRYYSNTLVDPDKQDGIDLFLGNYVPQIDRPHIWEVEKEEGVRYIAQERLLKKQQFKQSFKCNLKQFRDSLSELHLSASTSSNSITFPSTNFDANSNLDEDLKPSAETIQEFFETVTEKVSTLFAQNNSRFFYFNSFEEEYPIADTISMREYIEHDLSQSKSPGVRISRRSLGPIQLDRLDKDIDSKYVKVNVADEVFRSLNRNSDVFPKRSVSYGDVNAMEGSLRERPASLSRHSIQVLNTHLEEEESDDNQYESDEIPQLQLDYDLPIKQNQFESSSNQFVSPDKEPLDNQNQSDSEQSAEVGHRQSLSIDVELQKKGVAIQTSIQMQSESHLHELINQIENDIPYSGVSQLYIPSCNS
eukprot:TRINITY_DN4265_c1_g1_i1.p1 TRINITY_DN4265_c1_g1~~TRINITY_DN4265_c1_g1_i1.p1  ORF type:complete len:904 (-),score=70.58 TRINITY_DN4265_c1_g1_i1:1912-4623(-)